ncbi:MAG TPA: PLP-dependent aminotransferase family protein [Ornithinimicrobium sp.]|uniref:MocR-like pyridoxine biosynthesis transcription factor PdxR n=1 Tax=Ornithinimicrobium sp. TaxID=1977084 RepID=UPI002B49AC7A|nr:PLP-dependent aminotransferase family protein [Ornithinimicrobium sp.]HKJ11010.1 PLP-dependent aminotransferase family protein [Ornithinimicrobium sp.]
MVSTRIALERGSTVPLYRQLRLSLEHEIATGALDPNLPLPSSRALARELGLSRNTVNAAYAELEAEGFVEARPRRGLVVNRDMVGEALRGESATDEGTVDWGRHLRPRLHSGMAEIEKVRDWRHYPYPFVGGQVDHATFPVLPWTRALREALRPPHQHYSLRDGVDADDPELLQQLCRSVLPARGIQVEPEQVLVTLGSQQGLDLLARAVLRPGSRVGVEEPGYPDTRHVLGLAGAEMVSLPVDEAGVQPPEVPLGLDLVALTPSHHSPTNVTLSAARRRQILRRAALDDFLVVEDDYESELRYAGSPTPALRAMPDSERVVYLGTFSKFIAPGLRLGYLVAAPEVVTELRYLRRYILRHPSGHLQRAMALFIADGHYHRTIRRRRASLSQRWSRLTESLDRHLGWPIPAPPGGGSLWVPGPVELDAAEVVRHALRAGVVVERGDTYFRDPQGQRNHLRLGFAAIDVRTIDPGVRVLAKVIERHLSR